MNRVLIAGVVSLVALTLSASRGLARFRNVEYRRLPPVAGH